MILSLPEHYEWLVLRRVNRGGVSQDQDGTMVEFGQPLGCYFAQTLTEMIDEGLLEVGEPVPQVLAQLRHTDVGKARYSQLCRRQRGQARTPETPTDHRSSAAPLTSPDDAGVRYADASTGTDQRRCW